MLKRIVFLRSQPVKSQMQEVMFSNTAITVDMAAKSMNRKNRVPQIRPPLIALNTLGRVMNSRFGPAVGIDAEAEAGREDNQAGNDCYKGIE